MLNAWNSYPKLTVCERVLIFIIGCFSVVLTGFLFSKTNRQNYCVTEDCIQTSAYLLNFINREVNACDNFYEFACGRPKNELKESTHYRDEQANIVAQQLKLLLQEKQGDGFQYRKYPIFLYENCMNTSLIEQQKTTHFDNLKSTIGTWPVLVKTEEDPWNSDNNWSWQLTLQKLCKANLKCDIILDVFIDQDGRNVTKKCITIGEGTLGLEREFLLLGANASEVSAYYDFMVNVSIAFGAEEAKAKQQMNETLYFEIELAKITKTNLDNRNVSNLLTKYSLSQLQVNLPYMNWTNFIATWLPTEVQIDEDEEITVPAYTYLQELGTLLAKTPARTLANYMMWRLHNYALAFLPQKYRELIKSYQQQKSGDTDMTSTDRWRECAAIATNVLPYAMSALYIEKYSETTGTAWLLKIIEHMRSAFTQLIRQSDWLDMLTKFKAQEKLNAMQAYVGHASQLLDPQQLEEYYDKLNLTNGNYFESIVNISRFNREKSWRHLRSAAERTDYLLALDTTNFNAVYIPNSNIFVILCGLLKSNVSYTKLPKYLTYSDFGSVIGHEIMHGFDDMGRQFNNIGNIQNWWQPETEQKFQHKAQCLIDQFDKITDALSGLKLNGRNTLGENIADVGGYRAAYLAYKKWRILNNAEELPLPGLPYTQLQLFWINAAQKWCVKTNKVDHRKLILTDEHAPEMYRITLPFANLKEFSRDFNCPKNAPMNPETKCSIFDL